MIKFFKIYTKGFVILLIGSFLGFFLALKVCADDTQFDRPHAQESLTDKDRNYLLEIEGLKWQVINPDTTQKLTAYIDQKYSDEIIFAATDALALRADPDVFGLLQKALRISIAGKSGENSEKVRKEKISAVIRTAKNLVIFSAVYPPLRKAICYLLVYKIANWRIPITRWNAQAHWQGLSGADFIGNEALRNMIMTAQVSREADGDGSEYDYWKMIDPIIKSFFPEFPTILLSGVTIYNDWQARRKGFRIGHKRENPHAITPKILEKAKIDIFDSNSRDSALIKSVHSLLEESSFTLEEAYRNRLIELLKDSSRGDNLKQTIIAAFGNEPELHSDVQNVLLQFVEQSNDKIVIAAAKALRWKKDVPIAILLNRWEKTENEEVRIALESSIATIKNQSVFFVLMNAIRVCDQNSATYEIDLIRRIDNLKLWYVLLGNERDDVISPLLRKATTMEHNLILSWLRDTSTFKFYRDPPRVADGWFTRITDSNDMVNRLLPPDIRRLFIKLTE